MVREMIAAVEDAERRAAEIIDKAQEHWQELLYIAREKAVADEENAVREGKNRLSEAIIQKKAEVKKQEEEAEANIVKDIEEIRKTVELKTRKAVEEVKNSFY